MRVAYTKCHFLLIVTSLLTAQITLASTAAAQQSQLLAEGFVENGSSRVFADGDYIYFGSRYSSTDIRLHRVLKAGGPLETVASGFDTSDRSEIENISFSDAYIYVGYGGYDAHANDEVSRNSGARRTILPQVSGARTMGMVASEIYFFQSFSQLKKIGVQPGSNSIIVSTQSLWPRSILQSGDSIYFTNYNDYDTYRLSPNISSEPVKVIDQSRSGVEPAPFVNGQYVYSATFGLVRRAPMAGGAFTEIALPHSNAVVRLIDDSYIYYGLFTAQSEVRQLWRTNLDGADPELLDPNASIPHRMISNGDFLYWIDSRNGRRNAGLYRFPIGDLPPVANAGPDQAVRVLGEIVQLDGTLSFDDNTANNSLQYTWTLQARPIGSVASLTGAATPTPTMIVDVVGTYVVELVVTDELGQSSDADLVTISSENLAPTADAGPDKVTIVNVLTGLDGSGSVDPEGDTLGFSWTISNSPQGSTANLVNSNSANPELVPDQTGQYEVTLIVSDAIGAGTSDSVIITALTLEDYSNEVLASISTTVIDLPPSEVTTAGNQNAFVNFLAQAGLALQGADTAEALKKIDDAISRTDGCEKNGVPDANGPGRDWITDCNSQYIVYNSLIDLRTLIEQQGAQ